MQLYAVFGHPVSHSLSPAIHNSAFSAEKMACFYFPVEVAPSDLSDKLSALRQLGGSGVNLTRPLKETVWNLLADASDFAREIGAANILWWQPHKGWYGDNTDAQSLALNLELYRGRRQSGRALVLGGGGAARASVAALNRLQYESVLAVRRPQAVAWHATVWEWERALGADEGWDVVVNATPLGQDQEAAWQKMPRLVAGRTLVVDWVYRPRWTPLLTQARELGCPMVDGLTLLVDQARLGWRLWFGREGPKDAMWRGVEPWT